MPEILDRLPDDVGQLERQRRPGTDGGALPQVVWLQDEGDGLPAVAHRDHRGGRIALIAHLNADEAGAASVFEK
jgi:hypothetical protein